MPKSRPIEYATCTAGELARALAERDICAVELFDAAVARIEAENPRINAVVVRDFDRARDAAKAADAALARGEARPLLGVPMTVKESHRVAGLPASWGIAEHAGWTPRADSTGVTRLKAAGAVILGKTNIATRLGDWHAANAVYGRTNNPHDLNRTPGGSSGGAAAALATGMVPLELGSDIGGSIRVPAHFCGVFGHKPSYGLVPITGHAPPGVDADAASPEFDVIGPLARTASDLDLALQVLAGPDGDVAKAYRLTQPSARAKRLADHRVLILDSHPCCATDSQIKAALHRLGEALARAGAKVEFQSPLLPDLRAAHETYVRMLIVIVGRLQRRPDPIDAWAWMDGLDLIATHRRRWAALFEAFDVVLAPFGTAAFAHADDVDWSQRTLMIDGEATPYGAQTAWPGTATFPGLPATCMPISKKSDGLPIGVQVVGPRLEDRTTIAFAELVEREIGLV